MRYKGLKGKAWEALRMYICERDDWRCSTCTRTKEQGYQMNAGHYQPMGKVGSNNTLGWDEMNIHCQCVNCNNNGAGEQEKMAEYIRKKYGLKVLNNLKSRIYKLDPIKDWQAIINKFKKLSSDLSL